MSLNRISPILVTGNAGAQYVKRLGIRLLPNSELLEPIAYSRWQSWCKELASANSKLERMKNDADGLSQETHTPGEARFRFQHRDDRLQDPGQAYRAVENDISSVKITVLPLDKSATGESPSKTLLLFTYGTVENK